MSALALSPDFQAQQVLTGIRALLACFNGKNRCVLPSTRGLRIPMRLLGVWLQPPKKNGKPQDWLLQRKWKDSLLTAGIDPDRIEVADESKLWAAIERIEQRVAQQKQVRAQRKKGGPSFRVYRTELQSKPKVTESLGRVDEPTDTTNGQKQSADQGIIKISDGAPSPEFQEEARRRRDACCITHCKPQPARNFGVRTPGLAGDWPYPR